MSNENLGLGLVPYHRRFLLFQRLAGTPKHRSYNLAEHSYFVTTMFIHFAEKADVAYDTNTLKAVLNHDVVGVVTADLPYGAKNYNQKTRDCWEAIEKAVTESPPRINPYTDDGLKSLLNEEQYALFKAVDLVELWTFCIEERALGNQAEVLLDIIHKCERIITSILQQDYPYLYSCIRNYLRSFIPFPNLGQKH